MAVEKPVKISNLARAMIPREMATWATAAIMLAALEGGLAGVVVKSVFAGHAPDLWVNLAVAMVAGAPAFANILSFIFAALGHGRDKVKVMSVSMLGIGLGLVLMASAPISPVGLLIFTLGMILGRVLWSGVVTLRASVWRMNFSRQVRASITSRLMTAASLVMAVASAVIGLIMNDHPLAFRWIFPLAALIGVVIAWVYRKTRIRGGRRLLNDEQESRSEHKNRFVAMLKVLRNNQPFRHYMIAMMLFGSGNLMLMAPLIVVINEHFDLSRVEQILITSSIPLLLAAVSVMFWGKLLDGRHILAYRAIHSWSFVLALGSFAMAAISGYTIGFWIGSVLLGIAYGGAVLGWNLGHNDYSDDKDSGLYMATHVTLTGIRGLLMPTIGVLVYQGVNAINPALGPRALLLPFALVISGAFSFVVLARAHKKQSPAQS